MTTKRMWRVDGKVACRWQGVGWFDTKKAALRFLAVHSNHSIRYRIIPPQPKEPAE